MRPLEESETRVLRCLSALLLAALTVPPVTAATSEVEAQENEGFLAAKGRVTYRVYCANCHGLNRNDVFGQPGPTNPPQALRDLLTWWQRTSR